MNALPRQPEILICDDFAKQIARKFVDYCTSAIALRNHIHVGLTGGNTPRELYRCLARPENRVGLDMRDIEFYQGDERPVPLCDPDSNWGMMTTELLDPADVPQENRHRMLSESADLDRAASDYEKMLRRRLPNVDGLPVFDLLLLGMGSDGHIASLFPGTGSLNEPTRLIVANWVPKLRTTRLTATYPLINASRAVWIIVSGDQKAETIRQAIEDRDPRLPVTHVGPCNGSLAWLLDAPAASRLSPTYFRAIHNERTG